MKSIICKIDSTDRKRAVAIKQTELFAYTCELSKKQSLHLVLLAEELLGMALGLLEVESGSFWIEKENSSFKIFLQADAVIGASAKTRLLSASKTGENERHKGVSGKILKACEWLVCEDSAGIITPQEVMDGVVSAAAQKEWSLMMLRQSAQRDNKAESWDELEKSVLGKLADDVRVGLSSQKLKIVVEKIF